MDCFYAAVEVKDDPSLKGLPIAVGGTSGRGVLTTASYEARKFGVRSAMPTHRALELCKDLIIVKPHFERYKEESQKIRSIFREYTEVIQPLSLDEAYLDVTGLSLHSGSATLIAKEIKQRIYEETQLTASAGVAPNKFLAKVASDWRKPNGLMVITPDQVSDFVVSLPVKKISGVGKVMEGRLKDLGIKTCGDLQGFEKEELVRRFGKWGAALYNYARGVDNRPVETSSERKSLSVERTFFEDKGTLSDVKEELPKIYEEFLRRLEKSGVKNRISGQFVKLKFHDFQTTTHEEKNAELPSLKSYQDLLEHAYARGERSFRLIGIGVRLMSIEDYEIRRSQLKFEIE